MSKFIEFIVITLLFAVGVLGAYLGLVGIIASFTAFIEWDLSVFIRIYEDTDWQELRITFVICYTIGFFCALEMTFN